MVKEYTSIYKAREYGISWGIWIQVSGKVELGNDGIKISENLFLENKIQNKNLTFREMKFLLTGIKWIEPLIKNKIEFPTKIVLEGIEFNESDYQSEGLFYAIAFWSSETFGFVLPNYGLNYSKEENKYIFRI